MATESTALEALLKDKEGKIRRYMDLQDQADAVNEEIYKITCEIETLNVQIEAERLSAAAKQAGGKPQFGTVEVKAAGMPKGRADRKSRSG